MVIWILLQSFLTFLSFIILIASSDYPGGAVGMTPLAVLLAVSIQFIGSIALYFATKNLVKAEQNYVFFIIGMILYELSFAIFSDSIPIMDIFTFGFEGFISRCYSFSSIISGLCITIVFFLLKLKRG
ncbi:hypothetical protein M3B46_10980 [Sphingobacterium daejeonense]|uniref:hypothetical protein n=1 Tax=Sphingobacterium daejeonense TaxID=371142 RepID=UPI0021A82164|nr:hypothetical protein [Sphingobacterium daejeonense]MCT1531520.1 hypothetical protein [Sphingobacterium daejeonense]